MIKKNELFLAVALIATLSSTASAGVMVNLDYNGRGSLGRSMTGVRAYYAGGSYSGWAGQLRVNIENSGAFDFDGDHLVFCTELNENAGARNGQVGNYELDTLNNLSIPSTAPPMGMAQKIAMEKLFGLAGEIGTTNNAANDLKAAGFQVALWEISQDASFGNLASGNFRLSGTNSNFTQIRNTAQDFLDRLGNETQVSVLGMVSVGAQDFVTAAPPELGGEINSVPEPASFAIFGMIGLAACGRRRMS